MILFKKKDRRNEVGYVKNSPLEKQNDSFFATDAKNGAERSNKATQGNERSKHKTSYKNNRPDISRSNIMPDS